MRGFMILKGVTSGYLIVLGRKLKYFLGDGGKL